MSVMDTVVLAVQVALFGVFFTAGVTKLLDPPGSRAALTGFGLPDWAVRPGAWLLPLAELAIAAGLLVRPSARVAAVTALLLLAAFAAGIVRAMARGESPDCHCFGQIHSEPVGARTLARNAGFAALALVIVVAGPRVALDSWVSARSAAELVAIVAVATALALAAYAVAQRSEIARLRGDLARERAVLASFPPGLPVGTEAPGFTLPTCDGATATLEDMVARGRPVVLVFGDPACGWCEALLPDLARWQATLADRMTIALLTTGTAGENDLAVEGYGMAGVILQEGIEVYDAYRAQGTPSAVLISPDGRVAGPLAAGVYEIEPLIRSVLEARAPLAV